MNRIKFVLTQATTHNARTQQQQNRKRNEIHWIIFIRPVQMNGAILFGSRPNMPNNRDLHPFCNKSYSCSLFCRSGPIGESQQFPFASIRGHFHEQSGKNVSRTGSRQICHYFSRELRQKRVSANILEC